MMLHERLRPTCLAEVIGQTKAVQTAERLIADGIGGRAIWIAGASGVGKTSIARILAESIATGMCISEYDSADQFGMSDCEAWASTMQFCGFGKGGRALIINEAHALRAPVIRVLLGIIERLPQHALMIFTTTREGEQQLFEDNIEESPLLSRCTVMRLTNQGLAKAVAPKLMSVASERGLGAPTLERCIRLMQECKNNIRAAYGRIEAGELMA